MIPGHIDRDGGMWQTDILLPVGGIPSNPPEVSAQMAMSEARIVDMFPPNARKPTPPEQPKP